MDLSKLVSKIENKPLNSWRTKNYNLVFTNDRYVTNINGLTIEIEKDYHKNKEYLLHVYFFGTPLVRELKSPKIYRLGNKIEEHLETKKENRKIRNEIRKEKILSLFGL